MSADIRDLIAKQSGYFEDFLQYLIDWVCDICDQPHTLHANEVNLTNNILRVLTRVIPFLHHPDNQDETKKYLWDYYNPNYSVEELALNKYQKVVVYKCNDEQINKKREQHIPYGLKLLKALIQLCFYEEYTIPKIQPEPSDREEQKSNKSNQVGKIWCNLKGFNNQIRHMLSLKDSDKYSSNRLAVLQCMLACFS